MRILFIGSIPSHIPGTGQVPTELHEPMFAAARELGYEVAQQNHVVLIGSDSRNTIDGAVAAGLVKFCEANADAKRAMEIHRPNDSKVPFPSLPPNVEVRRQSYHEDESAPHKWVVTHVRALEQCDCVIAIGGGASTRIVGNIAADRRSPIVTVANFGGAARELFDRLYYFYKSRITDSALLQELVLPWNNRSASNVVGFAEQLATSAFTPAHLYFISYSWADSQVADHIEALLRRSGRRVLRDEDSVQAGGSLSGVIETLIKQCDTFVALWGEAYKNSDWCPGELNFAQNLQKQFGRPRVVLCKTDDTPVGVRFADRLEAECKDRTQRELTVLRLLREESSP